MSKHSPYGRGSRAKVCRQCGRHRDEAGEMSARALCGDCGKANVSQACDELHAGEGPIHEQWRAEYVRGMKAYADSL